MENIEIVGMSREEVEEKFKSLRKKLRIQYHNRPRSPSVARTIDKLIEEDWMNKPKTVLDVLDELKKREVSYAKEATVYTALRRREGKTLDRFKGGGEWTYRQRRSKTANG